MFFEKVASQVDWARPIRLVHTLAESSRSMLCRVCMLTSCSIQAVVQVCPRSDHCQKVAYIRPTTSNAIEAHGLVKHRIPIATHKAGSGQKDGLHGTGMVPAWGDPEDVGHGCLSSCACICHATPQEPFGSPGLVGGDDHQIKRSKGGRRRHCTDSSGHICLLMLSRGHEDMDTRCLHELTARPSSQSLQGVPFNLKVYSEGRDL